MSTWESLAKILNRPLIFVSGKGGVGKTTVSRALAELIAEQGRNTLWTCFEDPTRPFKVEPITSESGFSELNCQASQCFQEYIELKVRIPSLAKLFVQNRLMSYLAKAAPGIHEIVLLGKVWHERNRYDTIVVDMPATGHGIAMFQSTQNFSRLFQGGPIQKDADLMHQTFSDPSSCGHIITSLPEEMPLTESLELAQQLRRLFPANPPAFIVNRCFPELNDQSIPLEISNGPLAQSATDYLIRRGKMETQNLQMWTNAEISYESLPFVAGEQKAKQLAEVFRKRVAHE